MKPLNLTVELVCSEAATESDFRFTEREYLLRQENGYRSARLSWDSRLQENLAELARPSPDRGAVQQLGNTLGAFLGELGWAEHEKSLWEASQAGREVHITFRFDAEELYSLPWELVALRDSGLHLAELPGCHLHYEWVGVPAPAARAAPLEQGGRILFAWSVAGGNVPMEEHLRALREVCASNEYAFDPDQDVIGQVSLRSLDEALSATEGPVAALHILCHGARSPDLGSREYGLQWNASQGGGTAFVDAGDLRGVLARHAGKVRMVVLCACHSGNSVPDSHLGSVAQTLHRVGIPAVVASRMPLSLRGSTQLTETLYEELIGQLSPLDRALGAVRGRLKEDAERLDWASLQLYAQTGDEAALRPFVFRPYRGLLAFRPKDRRFFFGRSKLEAELLERVRQAARGQRSRFQIVAGASGAGKSSLVMAGLVPLLAKEEWDWLVVRPGELVRCGPDSAGERSSALQELRSRVHSCWSSEPLPVSGGALEQDLVGEVRRMRQARPARKLLLVLDQFEEVFTLLKSEERQALVRGAWALARQPELGCVVVATLRVDHFERCGEVVLEDGRRLDTVVYAEEHRVFVAQMGLEELAEAIEQPAWKVGLELETGLVDRLCRDVGREPGALPLLEHALDLLWQRRERQQLTHQAYEQMEGVAGALKQTAERLYEEFSEGERKQARRLMVRLVAVRDLASPRAQGRVWVEELRPQKTEERKAFEVALEKLVGSRLLVSSRGGSGGEEGRGAWVQLAHETLLRRWKRLERWVEEDWEREQQLRELEAWAEDWEEHQGSVDGGASYLLTGDRLVYAGGLREKHGGELSPRSRRLLEESQAAEARRHAQEQEEQEKEKETVRVLAEARARAARFFKGLFGVTAVLLALAMVAVVAISRLHEQEQTQRKTAQSTALLLLAEQYREQDPTKAALFLREVSSDARDERWRWAALDILQHPVATAVLRSHGRPVVSATFSSDGQRVIVASRDGTVRVWSADGKLLSEMKDDGGVVDSISISPDGQRVMIALDSGTAQVWSIDGKILSKLGDGVAYIRDGTFSPDGQRVVTLFFDGAWVWSVNGELLSTLVGHADSINSVNFSPDGQRIVTASDDGTARVWKVDGTLLFSLERPDEQIQSAAFSPDGQRVMMVSRDGVAQVWSADGKPLFRLEGDVLGADFSPDGKRVVAVTYDGVARIWSADGKPLSILKDDRNSVHSTVFSMDGQRIVTVSSDKTAQVWTVEGKLLSKLVGHDGAVASAAFSPDGEQVLTWSTDGTVRVWNPGREQSFREKKDSEVLPADPMDGVHVDKDESNDGTARVLNDEMELLGKLEDHGGAGSATLSPDGQWLLTMSEDGIPRLWHARGKLVAKLQPSSAEFRPHAFSLDGQRVVIASDDGKARVWSTRGELLATLPENGPIGYSDFSFSPDGRQIVSVSDGAVRMWSVSGESLGRLGNPAARVDKAAFSPDGHRVVMVEDRMVQVWSTGGELQATIMMDDNIASFALSPDNQRLVTLSLPETVCLWGMDGKLRAKQGGPDMLESVAFSSDGELVVMRPFVGRDWVWPVGMRSLAERVEGLTSYCLGADERQVYLRETYEEAQAGFERCQIAHAT